MTISLRRRTEIFLAILTIVGGIVSGFSIYPYSHEWALWFEVALAILAVGILTDLAWSFYVIGALCLCTVAVVVSPILAWWGEAPLSQKTVAMARAPELAPSPVAPPTFRSLMVARSGAEIAFGSVHFAVNGGIPLMVGGFSGVPFLIHPGPRGYLICDIRTFSIGTNQVIEVRDNVIYPLPDGWDTNSNQEGMEIVNEKYEPVLQMYYESPKRIRIRGIVVAPPAVLLATNEAMRTISFSDPDLTDALANFSLPRFFKYPSKMFPGVPN